MMSRKCETMSNSNGKEGKIAKRLRVVAVVSFVVSLTVVASVGGVYAAATEYFGEDLGLGEFTRLPSWPNSAAAEADFLSRLTNVGTQDFESFAGDTAAPLPIDFGAAGTATIYGNGFVRNLPSGAHFGRYPTSGDNYWESTDEFYIEFSKPIAAFGFYATDIGDFGGQVTVELANGDTRTYTVPNTVDGAGGSVLFYGIIEDDPTLQFTRVTFGNTAVGVDFFGFDDFTIGTLEQLVTHQTAAGGAAYPMWSVLLAGLMAGASLLVLRRRHRGQESA